MPNALAHATSPYLLQHQDNPVEWHEWSDQTLDRARELERPLLVSVGYAACHWCHVMAHESFENAEIAALMNRHFINIKVDREERPDIDAIYQNALALLGQQGGWPLTMFCTPAGEPFWGGTYFPPEQRYGRPGFAQILQQIADLWNRDRPKIEGNREALREALQRMSVPAAGELQGSFQTLQAARALAEEFDTVNGGIGHAPKFPQAPQLAMIWQAAQAARDPVLQGRVLHTLNRICQGGIYDHLRGGFARYSVDALWLVPHFEKMLYDNGQLLSLLAHAYAATGDELFHVRANETVDWLRAEMMTEGGFASSLDADSEGEEGRFYVWQAEEIERLLADEADEFKLAYGVTRSGNWEGKTILHRLHEAALPAPDKAERLLHQRQVLLAARSNRIPPARDDKVLADWNGLAIQGLVACAARFGDASYAELAAETFVKVVDALGEGSRIGHSWRDGKRLEKSFLDDYAQMTAAAIDLYNHTGQRRYLRLADEWIAQCDRDFGDPRGGWFLTSAEDKTLIVRSKNAHDGPTPSANGTLVLCLAKLAALTGDESYAERARRGLMAFSGDTNRFSMAHGTLLRAALALEIAPQIVIAGDPHDERCVHLTDCAQRNAPPDTVIMQTQWGEAVPEGHPAAGKSSIDGVPAAHLCLGQTCLPPAADPEALARLLSTVRLFGAGGLKH